MEEVSRERIFIRLRYRKNYDEPPVISFNYRIHLFSKFVNYRT